MGWVKTNFLKTIMTMIIMILKSATVPVTIPAIILADSLSPPSVE